MSIAEQLKASIIAGYDRRALRKILEFWPDVVDAHYHAHVKSGYAIAEINAEYARMAAEKAAR